MRRFCENCGEELKGNVKFCPKCGYKIEDNEESQENIKTIVEKMDDDVVKRKKGITVKIIVGAIMVAFVGGGIGAGVGYANSHQKNTKKTENIKKKEIKKTEEKISDENNDDEMKNQNEAKKTKVDYNVLLNAVDDEYLLKLCTYLPEYASVDQISDDELYNIYRYAMQYGMQFHANLDDMYICKERQIIPDDQFMNISAGTGKFKKNAFDKIYEWTGIAKKPEELLGDVYTYDDEGYYIQPTEALANLTTCKLVGKGYDRVKEELVFNVEKTEKDSMLSTANVTITEETVVIIPADNNLGYRIKSINNGYETTGNTEWILSDNSEQETQDNEYFSKQQIEEIKHKLNIPDVNSVTCEIGDSYYWDVGNRTLVQIDFMENNDYVAGAAVDINTAELVRNIYTYSR